MGARTELNRPRCFQPGSWHQALAAGLVLGMVASCATVRGPAPGSSQALEPEAPPPQTAGALPAEGISGMAALDDSTYLVVHDTKAHEDGPRVGLLQVLDGGGTHYRALEIDDWKDEDSRSNDLEAACVRWTAATAARSAR